MKKTRWLLAKLAFVLASLVFIYAYDLPNVSAQRGNCNTSQACTGWWWCTCGDTDCNGCFIPNGQGGCGTCTGGSTIND